MKRVLTQSNGSGISYMSPRATFEITTAMKFTFLISIGNQPPFSRVSDDRTFEEAMLTAQMFRECFPGARVEISQRKF